MFPVSLVLAPIRPGLDAVPIRFAVLPLPIVDLPVRVGALALLKLAVVPLSVIDCSVRENFNSNSISFAVFPVTSVFGAVW